MRRTKEEVRETLDFLPQVFVFCFMQVNIAHLCSSAADSQACFTGQITSRDAVKKHLRPWKVFKEMSKKRSVAGTLNPKLGLGQ